MGVEVLKFQPDPSGYTSYSPDEQKDLATYIKKCRVDQENLKSTQKYYSRCQKQVAGKLLWWQTPIGVVSIGLGGVITGLVLHNLSK